jgi:8-oxo-dGTP pyrophosphatase MutT (NUDIX family)
MISSSTAPSATPTEVGRTLFVLSDSLTVPVEGSDLPQETESSPGSLQSSFPVEKSSAGAATVALSAVQYFGGVLFAADGRVAIRASEGEGGGLWTWPTGQREKHELPEQTALRAMYVATGYRAQIIGVLPGAYLGTQNASVFFVMQPLAERTSNLQHARTRWVDYKDACALLQLNKQATKQDRDRRVLDDAFAFWLLHNSESTASVRATLFKEE